jgi:hypothetical protein
MQLQSSKQKNINNFYFACTNGIAFRNKSQSIVEEDLAKKKREKSGLFIAELSNLLHPQPRKIFSYRHVIKFHNKPRKKDQQ